MEPIEKGTSKKNPTEPGEKPMDPSKPVEPIGGTRQEGNPDKQNEDKTEITGEEPSNESENQREEEENSGTTATKRKVSRT